MTIAGFRLIAGLLDEHEQRGLAHEVMAAAAKAPFYRPVTPWGKQMSVEMTNLGSVGWVSSPRGYAYAPAHPQTGQPWPPMPIRLRALWAELADPSAEADACLVNLYRGAARMGLHQDRDEADFTIPVLSVSLGDTAVFRLGGPSRTAPARLMTLSSGDVCLFAGEARLAFHGVDKVSPGTSDVVPGGGSTSLFAAPRQDPWLRNGQTRRSPAMQILTRPEGASASDRQLTRRGASAVLFAGYAMAGFSAEAEPIHTDDQGLVTTTVSYPSSGFQVPAYLARPRASGRFPTIMVVSEVFGLHEYIRDICRRLAKLGYVTFAPAFFVRVGDPAPLTDLDAIFKIVAQASDQQVLGDIASALTFLRNQPFVDKKRMAVTGFCWGGGVTWLACENFPEFAAGVAWYGRMVRPASGVTDPNRLWPAEGVSHLHGPVLGLYGGKDPSSASVPQMRAALTAAGRTDSQIIVYPDAAHGFHADYRSSYNAADAADGWSRMLAFFAAHGVGPRPFQAS